ncbi:hypothetical protein ACFWM1_15820 [Nocardia sp. NPDC058379]|uniref:hypothetical protein n=1 Tax=unclassified Nocardia TaxID=2637762 RepID=UPI003665C093
MTTPAPDTAAFGAKLTPAGLVDSPLVRSMVEIAARIAWADGPAVGSSPDRNPVVTAGMIGRRTDLAH